MKNRARYLHFGPTVIFLNNTTGVNIYVQVGPTKLL